MLKTWALVPIRSFVSAKQRLSRALSETQRALLAEAMAAHVVQLLLHEPLLAGVAVVSPDPRVRDWAEKRGALPLAESVPGLNNALRSATDALVELGAGSLLVVPGDLPSLSSSDLRQLLKSARENTVLIVAAARDGGTNGLLMSPPAAIGFHFGPDSALRHLEAAIRAGVKAEIVDLPTFARDIDEPEDLAMLPDALSKAARASSCGTAA
jgi:2-phospho-L-lactate guanylyltransferase